MQITSNDSIKLQEFYNELKRNRAEVELKEEQVEGAMGILPTIELKSSIDLKSSDFTTMIRDMFVAWLEYKKFKLYIDSKEAKIEDFDKINENSKIKVEFDER